MADSEQNSASEESLREVRFEHSKDFPELLQQLSITLLVSTYQAGKLVVLGTHEGQLALSFHNFEQAMGVAIHPQQIAVGARTQVWFLKSAADIAAQFSAQGKHDACYLTRSCHVTDEIHVHEMAWCGDELWLVNTRFSCLCTLDEQHSFVPRWRPPFITQLAPEDRCHLNGLAVHQGRPLLVTTMSTTDSAHGWRPQKATTGCLLDVATGEAIASGFAMPHSPRFYQDRIWVLDSGRGQLVAVDSRTGKWVTVSAQPGYTRGLDFAGPFAFLGLSKVRETATFGGVPIAAHPESLKCGVAVVDLRTGAHVAHFEFLSGVDEIFDVRVLATARHPLLSGPMALAEGRESIWHAPSPEEFPTPLPGTPAVAMPRSDAVPQSNIPPAAVEQYRRGLQHAEQDQFQAATDCFEKALELAESFSDAQWNLGIALQFLGRIDDSVTALRRAVELQPDLPAAHLNLAMSLFLQGDFAAAWPEYAWRWRTVRFAKRPVAAAQLAPAWQGESLSDKTILVYGEQGIGDEIMFASLLPQVMTASRRCIVACNSRLEPIFRRSFPSAAIVPVESLSDVETQQGLGSIHFQVAAGSTCQYLRSEIDVASAVDGFLVPDPTQRHRWQSRLANLPPGLRVGISWRGGSTPEEIRRRSTNPADWAPLLSVPGAVFVNLQYGVQPPELNEIQTLCGTEFVHFPEMDPLCDMDDFASLVACLDLVISVDNTTVHLAGALGIPTWVLLSFPSSSYWRWLLEGEHSVWYRSLRLFRKRSHQDSWSRLMPSIADDLRTLINSAK